MLTVAYMTNRKNPRFNWFSYSLANQVLQSGWKLSDIRVVIVDFYADEPGRCNYFATNSPEDLELRLTPPKPNVWQGKHRITKANWFAASNARNTALCLAPDGYIAYVDDLSVLMPGWFQAVREAIQKSAVTMGAYKKVRNLVVESGVVKSCEEFPSGVDSRWNYGRSDGPVVAGGGWLFGCSLVCPTQFLIETNGWDEDCDSMGGEDYTLGIMFEKHGRQMFYDRRMLTYESEEAHYEDPPFRRADKGVSPNDASHDMLKKVMSGGRKISPNYFGSAGIRGLRHRVLNGEEFPIVQCPEHHWFDGQPLREMV